ncbi:response regulator [Gulosibacter chungangensis]|uniref:Response regulator transcription factor n=1 Tax=Gulosibacter chungangensis TaxID=979746 RepID=A0A7J5BCJ7_9MICO|nr:response regulator transcription factor [Gulosibacter chungangensis]KAB1643928.1 response regulator transcription factor [Gulosibacter chungangensis]
MPSVVIVDDHSAVRAGVAAILAADPEIVIVGEAGSVREAIEQVTSHRPDVVILDVQLPDGNGIDICREITSTLRSRVLILTAYEIPENISAALDAGASGFLAKTAEPNQMIDAVRAVANGQAYLTPSVTQQVIAQVTGKSISSAKASGGLPELTEREQEVLELIAEGLTNKQIAGRLTISPATAKTHVSRIMQKLGASTRTQAAMLARTHNRPSEQRQW